MRSASKPVTVKYFSSRQRGKRRRRATALQIVSLRLVDLAKLFRARYQRFGEVAALPDDDSGRDDLLIAVDHLAALAHPAKHVRQWIELWAPWLTLVEFNELVASRMLTRQVWTADALAWRLKLTWEDRQALGITTIGAIDMPKGARKKRRRKRDQERKSKTRLSAGAKPRRTYERNSLEHKQPWKELGISRRTWFRRNRGTGPATA